MFLRPPEKMAIQTAIRDPILFLQAGGCMRDARPHFILRGPGCETPFYFKRWGHLQKGGRTYARLQHVRAHVRAHMRTYARI